MKGVALIVFFACAIITMAKPMSEQEMMQQMIISCKEEVGASDQDVERAMSMQMATTDAGKCMETCIMSKNGGILDNKLNPDSIVNWAARKTGNDADIMELSRKVAMECVGVASDNPCELWHNIVDCLMAEGAKQGLDPAHIL